MCDFMEDLRFEIGKDTSEGVLPIAKRVYLYRIGKAYRLGQINTLLEIGKTTQEIAEILDLNESTIISLIDNEKQRILLNFE